MKLNLIRFYMSKVVVGVGSNVGNRIGTIHKGIDLLAKKGNILHQSFLYETDPMYVDIMLCSLMKNSDKLINKY